MVSILKHVRDIFLLPGTVIGIVPSVIYNYTPEIIPGYWTIKIFATSILLLGFLLFCWTIQLFNNKAKGTLAPWTSKTELVTSGPYKYIRNPMILGVVLILLAMGLLSRSVYILIWAKIFLLIKKKNLERHIVIIKRKYQVGYRGYDSQNIIDFISSSSIYSLHIAPPSFPVLLLLL